MTVDRKKLLANMKVAKIKAKAGKPATRAKVSDLLRAAADELEGAEVSAAKEVPTLAEAKKLASALKPKRVRKSKNRVYFEFELPIHKDDKVTDTHSETPNTFKQGARLRNKFAKIFGIKRDDLGGSNWVNNKARVYVVQVSVPYKD